MGTFSSLALWILTFLRSRLLILILKTEMVMCTVSFLSATEESRHCYEGVDSLESHALMWENRKMIENINIIFKIYFQIFSIYFRMFLLCIFPVYWIFVLHCAGPGHGGGHLTTGMLRRWSHKLLEKMSKLPWDHGQSEICMWPSRRHESWRTTSRSRLITFYCVIFFNGQKVSGCWVLPAELKQSLIAFQKIDDNP